MLKPIEIVRIFCGLFILVSGLMNLGLFGFEPPEVGPAGRQFQIAIQESVYLLPIVTVVFILAGVGIVVDRFGALASLAVAPIAVNILLFHVFSSSPMLPMAVFFGVVSLYCLWYYREAFAPLLKSKA